MYYLLKEEFDLKQLWDLVKWSACLLNHVWCWNLKSTGQAVRKERWTQIMGRSRSSRAPISMCWDSMKTNCNLDFHGFPACQCGWAAAAGAFSQGAEHTSGWGVGEAGEGSAERESSRGPRCSFMPTRGVSGSATTRVLQTGVVPFCPPVSEEPPPCSTLIGNIQETEFWVRQFKGDMLAYYKLPYYLEGILYLRQDWLRCSPDAQQKLSVQYPGHCLAGEDFLCTHTFGCFQCLHH